jgi:hypothetical protein
LLQKIGKDVNKDLWDLTLDFSREIADDSQLSKYDADSAWPVIIDEFVAVSIRNVLLFLLRLLFLF